jgi:hypothetical protein
MNTGHLIAPRNIKPPTRVTRNAEIINLGADRSNRAFTEFEGFKSLRSPYASYESDLNKVTKKGGLRVISLNPHQS